MTCGQTRFVHAGDCASAGVAQVPLHRVALPHATTRRVPTGRRVGHHDHEKPVALRLDEQPPVELGEGLVGGAGEVREDSALVRRFLPAGSCTIVIDFPRGSRLPTPSLPLGVPLLLSDPAALLPRGLGNVAFDGLAHLAGSDGFIGGGHVVVVVVGAQAVVLLLLVVVFVVVFVIVNPQVGTPYRRHAPRRVLGRAGARQGLPPEKRVDEPSLLAARGQPAQIAE